VRRLLADQRAAGRDLLGQLVVLRRIDVQHAAGKDGERPPAGLQRPAMGGRVDSAGQAADDCQPGAGEAGGQPLGLPQPVMRAVPRADDADGQGVGRPERAADEEQAGRVRNLAEGAGIFGVGLGDDADALAATEGDLGFGVDLVAGADDPLGELGADAFHRPQIAGRRGEDIARLAEAVQEAAANPRADAIHQRQTHRVDEMGIGGHRGSFNTHGNIAQTRRWRPAGNRCQRNTSGRFPASAKATSTRAGRRGKRRPCQ
jgi:hypothetical protein